MWVKLVSWEVEEVVLQGTGEEPCPARDYSSSLALLCCGDTPGLGCAGGASYCSKVCLMHSGLNLSHILKISFSWAFRF